ncbi:MAG: flavin reductase family protein [Xanthomonadales bacterium]|nr:flavin reductase family protein [Xanthomonadales bacterium]
MSLDGDSFREIMGHFATGVAVVTTVTESGTDAGITVNSLASVSLQPPLVLWSIGRDSAWFGQFSRCLRFVVHILAEDQQTLSDRFAQVGDNLFEGLELDRSPEGIALIRGCHGSLNCRSAAQYPGGDHVILLGEVESMCTARDTRPLIYHRGGYCGLAHG